MCSLFLAMLHSPIMNDQSFSSDIRRYALAGAQARLTEMAQEVEAIRRAFPELRETRGQRRRANAAEQESDGESVTLARTRRRRTMSAAQRKAVGERMKRYWAARRGGSETTGTTISDSAEKASKTARGAVKRGPRNMSPEARRRISDAQKARWAAQRSGVKATDASESSEAPSAATKRRGAVKARTRAAKRGPRKVSPAARKRMSQAQKKRWAAKRKAV